MRRAAAHFKPGPLCRSVSGLAQGRSPHRAVDSQGRPRPPRGGIGIGLTPRLPPYQYMDMESLTKKTTILLSPELHERLTRLAQQKGTSLGELVRSACKREYGGATAEEKLA